MPQIRIFLRDQHFMTWTKSQTWRVYFDVLWQWSFFSFSLYFPSITFKPLNSLCRFSFVFNEHNGFSQLFCNYTIINKVQQSIKVFMRSQPWCMYFKSALKIYLLVQSIHKKSFIKIMSTVYITNKVNTLKFNTYDLLFWYLGPKGRFCRLEILF